MRFCNAALSGLALISLVASTACPQEDEPPSLEVTVAVPSLLRSGCIKVRQTWGDGTLTSTLGQAPSTNVAFTIRDAPEGVQSVTLEAVGYLDCHEVVRAEWGDPRTVEFLAAGPSKVQLELSH